jgi:hypothetical protein
MKVWEETVKVKEGEFERTISVKNFPAGLYILNASSGCQRHSKKIIIYR